MPPSLALSGTGLRLGAASLALFEDAPKSNNGCRSDEEEPEKPPCNPTTVASPTTKVKAKTANLTTKCLLRDPGIPDVGSATAKGILRFVQFK